MKRLIMMMCLLLTGLTLKVEAGSLSNQPVSYITTGEPLFIAVRSIERSIGMPVVLRQVNPDQPVSGKYLGTSASHFLDEFTARNRMVWAKQGDQIVFAPLGTDLRQKPEKGISAPSSFSRVLHDPKDANKYGLMIFQLHNSWAEDKTVGTNKVAGVATLFRDFIGIRQNQQQQAGQNTKENLKVDPISNSQKAQISILGLLSKQGQPQASAVPGEPSSSPMDVNTRGVYADGRLNAILVRDKISMFENYKQIIALLDRPSDMVQLDAYIVDIERSKILQYGLDLSLTGGTKGNSLILSPFKMTNLLEKVQLGETRKSAHFLSVPTVVSMNNIEANFSARQNFFIKVEGKEDASLNKVTAETLLRVTPSIANESPDVPFDQRRIRIFVNIQDAAAGQTQEGMFDNSTRENQINTQAVVRSGDSLMIGGQIVTKQVDASTGLPILGNLPVVGGLFSAKGVESREYIRIYLIRPIILGEDSTTARLSQ